MKHFKTLAAAVAVATSALTAHAVPAYPRPLAMTQPDGSVIEIRLHGDERHHYSTDAEGRVVARGTDGFYYFAALDAEGAVTLTPTRADNPAAAPAVDASEMLQALDLERSLALRNAPMRSGSVPGLFSGGNVPATGSPKVLVVLVEFDDLPFKVEAPADFYDRMFHEEGFSSYYGTGSALDYFTATSMGQYTPDIVVAGPVKVSKGYAHYGGNNRWGNDSNVGALVVEACRLLDDELDFSQFDTTGDGYIDNVFLIYAGLGEATGGGADTIWPHASWVSGSANLDGVTVGHYACANEWYGTSLSSGYPEGIGTFCHEFSHCMGLPDLYATSYTSSFTPGEWDVMDQGPYNNYGYTPPLYSAWERAAMGWLAPEEITGDMDCTLPPVADSNRAYIIRTSKADEFFILENRQRKSWDAFIPGHGMLVWHIDYNSQRWSQNSVNNTPEHQYVDLEEADGTQTDGSRDGDAFPGTRAVTSFTDDTTPSMRTWSNTPLGKPITQIAETAPYGTVTFRVGSGATPLPSPTLAAPKEVTPRSFVASWSKVGEASYYRLSVYTKDSQGHITYAPGYNDRDVAYSHEVTVSGLEPSTAYLYQVVAVSETASSRPSNEMAVNTSALTHEYVIPTVLEAEEVADNSFKARWEAVDGADSYLLSVNRRSLSGTSSVTEGFDDSRTSWFTTSTQFYRNTNYSVKAPSLRLLDGEYLCSPYFEEGIRTVSFYHRSSDTDPSARLVVEAMVSESWLPVAYVGLTTSRRVYANIYSLPEGSEFIRITLDDPTGDIKTYIDDVRIVYGGTSTLTPVLVEAPAGAGTSYTVDGLASGSEYFYSVRAVRAGAKSMSSAEQYVHTTGASAVERVGVDAAGTLSVTSEGGVLTITTPAGSPLSVFTADGRLLYSGIATAAPTSLSVRPGTVCVVRAGAAVAKAIVR